MEDISKKILKLRKERGWSQKELAKQLNVSDKLISKWETSQSTPSIDYIKEMCKIFNVDMSEFVDVPKKKKKLSSKAKKGIIISTVMFFAACIIAGFVVLSVYIFVPALFKEKYLFNLSMSFGRNFSGTSFNFTISGRGAEQNFIGRFDDGKVEWQYKSRKFGESSYDIEILKDNILYKKEYSQVTKTIYKPTCKNLLGLYEEMMAYYGNDTSDVNVDEIPITYIRKSNDTYIFVTGLLSPVSADSSQRKFSLLSTRQSAGIPSPSSSSMTSPTTSCDASISRTFPSLTAFAVGTDRFLSFWIAESARYCWINPTSAFKRMMKSRMPVSAISLISRVT